MSVSSIAGSQASYQPSAQQTQFRQDFQSLTSALSSGDLKSAQAAYATLVQDNPQLAQSSSGSSGNPMQQAIAAIGQSLQSGDLSGAQNALSSFQQTVKSHHGHHHHHAQAATASTTSTDGETDGTTPDASSSTATALDLTA